MERLGENCLVKMIDQFTGAGCLGGKTLNPRKSDLDAANDFCLLARRGNWQSNRAKSVKTDLLLSNAFSNLLDLAPDNFRSDTINEILSGG